MSLFNTKNEKQITITDLVWIKESAKWQACLEVYNKDSSVIFIAWFEETQQRLQSFFKTHNIHAAVMIYREAAPHYINNNPVIFIEHYPLHKNEEDLYRKLNLEDAIIYSSLDEPLFTYFGGEKIVALLEKTGIDGNECIQHALVTTALKNAQEKIAKKIMIEQTAQSASDWFSRNMKKN